MTRLRAIAAAAFAAAVVALAACGDDGASTSSAGTRTTTSTSAGDDTKRVVIQAEDGAFDAQQIYQAAAPGVVTIRSVLGGGGTSGLFGSGGGGQGQGSGFVISDGGEILTNAHVVTDAETTGTPAGPLHEAKEVYVQFADQNQVSAEIVGFDPFADVALLQVDPEGLDLTPLTLGSEHDVQVGDPVAAIGSPFGKDQSLSVGVVSAINRSIDSLTNFQIDGAIQTDASINPGNSGGPLLDASGEVIGIDQQINTTSGGNEGVGFAVPIDLAQRSVEQLRDGGEVAYAYAGVTTQPLWPQLADELGLGVDTGALVSDVVDGSPADEAGLRAGADPIRFQGVEVTAGGDVITAVDGDRIEENSELPRIISLLDPGDTVTLDIIRDGEPQELELTLGARPTRSAGP